MTVETEHRKITYLGNNSLQTFSYNFEIPEEEYGFIFITAASGGGSVEYTDVTWSGIGDEDGGTVTFNVYTPISTDIITIIREVEYIQETDYVEGGLFRAETHEDTFDYSRFVDQQLKETLDRTIRVPFYEDGGDILILPDADDRAGQFLWFNEDGEVETRVGSNFIDDHDHSGGFESGGQVHHHVLVGLVDDDHTQYHTDGRGDIRYYTQAQVLAQIAAAEHHYSKIYSDGTWHMSYYNGSGVNTGLIPSNNNDILYWPDPAGAPKFGPLGDIPLTSVVIDSNPGNGEAHGFFMYWEAGETIAFGDALYIKSGKVYKCNAWYEEWDTYHMPCIGLASNSGSVPNSIKVLMRGIISDSSRWSYSPNDKIYVRSYRVSVRPPASKSVGHGKTTNQVPSSQNDQIQVLGIMTDANTLLFDPDYMIIERI